MSTTENVNRLRELSITLTSDALEEIRSHRQKADTKNEVHLISGEYLLIEGAEYVEATWQAILSERYNASLALSRWILEAALNLSWAVANKQEKDSKLRILAGEALRCEANLQEGLAILRPKEATTFYKNAEEARTVRESLGVDKPLDLERRLQDIKQEDNPKWPDLYPFYRICCGAAHPSLKVWERFAHCEGTTVSTEPISKQDIACWIAAASALYLVTFVYCLAELGDLDQLKAWWADEVSPLL